MECRGTHLTCAGNQGCGKTFEYLATETPGPAGPWGIFILAGGFTTDPGAPGSICVNR